MESLFRGFQSDRLSACAAGTPEFGPAQYGDSALCRSAGSGHLVQKNRYADETGHVFVIYPIDKLAVALSVSETAVKRHPKTLTDCGTKDDEAVDALCDGIREHGVLSPLLARPVANGYVAAAQGAPNAIGDIYSPVCTQLANGASSFIPAAPALRPCSGLFPDPAGIAFHGGPFCVLR